MGGYLTTFGRGGAERTRDVGDPEGSHGQPFSQAVLPDPIGTCGLYEHANEAQIVCKMYPKRGLGLEGAWQK